ISLLDANIPSLDPANYRYIRTRNKTTFGVVRDENHSLYSVWCWAGQLCLCIISQWCSCAYMVLCTVSGLYQGDKGGNHVAIRTLWNAGTLSEFIAVLNGDCGPTATLSALNWKNSQRWPLNATGLKAVDDDEIGHGFAEANGAQNISHMDAYLTYLGVSHT